MRRKRGGGAGAVESNRSSVGCRTRRVDGGGDGGDEDVGGDDINRPLDNVVVKEEEGMIPDRSRSRVAKRGGKAMVTRLVKRKGTSPVFPVKRELDEDGEEINEGVVKEEEGNSNKRTKLERGDEEEDGGSEVAVVTPKKKVNKVVVKVEGNPLENKEILKMIFDLYPPTHKDLLNIRLVSKLWKDVTLPIWRSKAILKLLPEPAVLTREEKVGICKSSFLRHMEDPLSGYQLTEYPFTHFKFHGLKLQMHRISGKGDQSEDARFWKGVGPHIKYLHLNMCEFLEVETRPLECLVLEKVPKLQEFLICDSVKVEVPGGPGQDNTDFRRRQNLNVRKVGVVGGTPIKFPELLKLFPNIKELFVRNGLRAKYSASVMTLLNGLRRQSGFRKYNLEKLDIKGTYIINNSIINPWMGSISDRFTQMQFQLKNLCMEVTPLERADSIFHPLLQANSNVESLELCIVPRYPLTNLGAGDKFNFRTPMDNLVELKLWGNVIQNFKFLKFVPNLEKLYLNPLCFEKWTGRGKHHQPLKKDLVKNTRLDGPLLLGRMRVMEVDHELSVFCVKKLVEWMPGLKVLRTILNEETFPMVCKGWGGLRELRGLWGSKVGDDEITGMGRAKVVTKGRGKGKWVRGRKEEGGGLVDLKELNSFILDAYCGEARLGDGAAYNGFLKMPSLMNLKICVGSEMSLTAESLLKKAIGCVRVIRNDGPGPHPNYDCCIRRRFINRMTMPDAGAIAGVGGHPPGILGVRVVEEEEEDAALVDVNDFFSDDDSSSDDSSDDDDAEHNALISDSDDENGGRGGGGPGLIRVVQGLPGGAERIGAMAMPPGLQGGAAGAPAGFLPLMFAFQQLVGHLRQ